MLDDLTELPEGWEETTLGDIVLSITYGHTASATDQTIGPKFLRITDLQNNSVNWENVPYCECKESEKYQLKAGDIVVERTGATTGKSYLIQHLPEPTVFASYLIRLQTSLLCSVEYLAIFMQSDNYWEQITTVSKGTAQPGANASILATLTIPLPPLNEQKRIVAKIEELRSHTQAARSAIAHIPKLLEQFRQSVLAAAFRGDLTAEWRSENPDVEPAEILLQRIRKERRDRWESTELEKMQSAGKIPKDDKWKSKYKEPIEAVLDDDLTFPESWKCTSVEQISSKVVDGVHQKPNYSESGVPFITIKNLTADSSISFEDVKYISLEDHNEFYKRANPQRGDILITKDGTLGVTRAVRTDKVFSIFVSVALVKPIIYEMSDYLELAFSSPQMQEQMLGTGSGLMHIHLQDLRRYIVPISPINEQYEIIRRATTILKNIDRIEEQYQFIKTELDRLDRSILAKAFKGELVPQDPTDEAAIVLLERIRNDRSSQIKPAKTKRKKA